MIYQHSSPTCDQFPLLKSTTPQRRDSDSHNGRGSVVALGDCTRRHSKHCRDEAGFPLTSIYKLKCLPRASRDRLCVDMFIQCPAERRRTLLHLHFSLSPGRRACLLHVHHQGRPCNASDTALSATSRMTSPVLRPLLARWKGSTDVRYNSATYLHVPESANRHKRTGL